MYASKDGIKQITNIVKNAEVLGIIIVIFLLIIIIL